MKCTLDRKSKDELETLEEAISMSIALGLNQTLEGNDMFPMFLSVLAHGDLGKCDKPIKLTKSKLDKYLSKAIFRICEQLG